MHLIERSFCLSVFVHLCVGVCHVHSICDNPRLKGNTHQIFLSQRTHFRLFRSLDIKNATGWVMGYIVMDSLEAFCPWFDSWEPRTVVSSRVFGFSDITVSIPTI